MNTIITTTGISLHHNTIRIYNEKHNTDIKIASDEQMWEILCEYPERASAEIKSLNQIAHSEDYLILLYTDKEPAFRCVSLIEKFLITMQKYQPFQVQLKQLKFVESEQYLESHGMRNLVNVLIHEITRAKDPKNVIINATAGMKAQTVYSTMIGMIYQVPVKYIYEDFQKVVTFTPMAIDWDTDLFLYYEPFFTWIDAEPRSEQEVLARLLSIAGADVERVRSILTPPDDKSFVFLNPMGEAFWSKYKGTVEKAKLTITLPRAKETDPKKKVANSIAGDLHHYPDRTMMISLKIAELLWVEAVEGSYFEPTTRVAVKVNTEKDDDIKKIEKDHVIPVLWADNKKAANLRVRTTNFGKRNEIELAIHYLRKILENYQ